MVFPPAATVASARPSSPGIPRAAVAGLALLALLIDAAASARLAHLSGTANDLFPRWYGARALLLHGQSPYAPEVDEGILAAMGGAPGYDAAAGLGGFVFGFVYPPYVAVLLAPLAMLPFPVAATLWLLLAQLALVGGLLLAARAACGGAVPIRRLSVAIVATCLPTVPAIADLAFGQFSALVFFFASLSWYFCTSGSYYAAGLALAAMLLKPQLAAVFAPAVLSWSLLPVARGAAAGSGAARWRLAVGFAGGASALLLLGWVAVPDWPQSFVRSARRYAEVAQAVSAVSLAAQLTVPQWAGPLTAAGAAAALGWLGAAIVRAAAGTPAGVTNLFGTAAIATLLVVPPLYDWNAVLLFLPFTALLGRAAPAFAMRRGWLAVGAAIWLVLLVVDAGLWLRFPSEHRLLWPFAAGAAWLLWGWRR